MSSPDDPTPRGDSREVAGSIRRVDDPPMWESMVGRLYVQHQSHSVDVVSETKYPIALRTHSYVFLVTSEVVAISSSDPFIGSTTPKLGCT
jgi:hypothetical protein